MYVLALARAQHAWKGASPILYSKSTSQSQLPIVVQYLLMLGYSQQPTNRRSYAMDVKNDGGRAAPSIHERRREEQSNLDNRLAYCVLRSHTKARYYCYHAISTASSSVDVIWWDTNYNKQRAYRWLGELHHLLGRAALDIAKWTTNTMTAKDMKTKRVEKKISLSFTVPSPLIPYPFLSRPQSHSVLCTDFSLTSALFDSHSSLAPPARFDSIQIFQFDHFSPMSR